MRLNNQIYQLFWNTIKCKQNLLGYKCINRSELKFLSTVSPSYGTRIADNFKKPIASIQNYVILSAAPTSRNFSNSSVVFSQNEQSHSKENNNEDEKGINGPCIGEGSWKEVYSGVLTTQLKLLKMFSIGSSVIGLSMQPILYEKLGNADIAVVVTLASFLGFFTFITPALIHWVSKKYVTKLEYDPERDMYAATTLSFFVREKKIHFKVDEVIRPDIPGLFTSFLVKNQSLFVDPNLFDDIDHYSRLMGFDQPIDFSIKEDEKSDS